MTARAPLYGLLSQDPKLQELGFEAVYAQNDVDSPEEPRFVVIRWETPDARAYAQRATDHATVWFHDKDRSYDIIDLGIERLKEIVRDALHVSASDGWVLTQAHWNSDGPDLFDDGFQTVVRYSDITVNSRFTGTN